MPKATALSIQRSGHNHDVCSQAGLQTFLNPGRELRVTRRKVGMGKGAGPGILIRNDVRLLLSALLLPLPTRGDGGGGHR